MQPPRRHGFTIIELLVSISIIVLMVAILLPTLGKARATVRAAKCASNLHQVGAAYTSRRADEKIGGNTKDIMRSYSWTGNVLPYLGGDARGLTCPEGGSCIGAYLRCFSGNDPASSTYLYDMPLGPGKFCAKLSATQYAPYASGGRVADNSGNYPPFVSDGDPNHFFLTLEDQRPDGGDWDMNDVMVEMRILGDGWLNITTKTKQSLGYGFQLVGSDGSILIAKLTNQMSVSFKVTASSYGMNRAFNVPPDVAADPIRDGSRKVLILDYEALDANPLIDNWSQWKNSPGDRNPTFFRHLGQANVLLGDLSVKAFGQPAIDITNTAKGGPQQRYWLPD